MPSPSRAGGREDVREGKEKGEGRRRQGCKGWLNVREEEEVELVKTGSGADKELINTWITEVWQGKGNKALR